MNTNSNQCQANAAEAIDAEVKAKNELLHAIVGRSVDRSRGQERRDPRHEYGIITGKLAGIANEGLPLVDLLDADNPIAARSIIAWSDSDVGRDIVLIFERGDRTKPIIMGFLQDDVSEGSKPVAVEADNERLVLSAEKEIVLRCGDASITLTREGRILIRGKHLVSRSTGANKIKGASVQLN